MFRSRFFSVLISPEGRQALEKCLQSNAGHITIGASGCHVQHIQLALKCLAPTAAANISRGEIAARTYGKTTAAAVLSYKTTHGIVNPTYQSAPDSIVGKITIFHIDASLAAIGW